MSERQQNYQKLLKIYKLTCEGKYAVIRHVDGFDMLCKADCFGEQENGEPDLRIITWDLHFRYEDSEIITGADVVSVEEYKPNN